MIRPFDLRDLPLLHRLSEGASCLHAESAIINDVHPVRTALSSLVMGRHAPTYVWKADDGDTSGFAQLQLREDGTQAQIVCLATDGWQEGDGEDARPAARRERVAEDAWLSLLDALAAEAGSRGVQNLVAEVRDTGEALPVLRQANFAVYTREDIWVLQQYQSEAARQLLRPRREADDWDIHLLYANIVPRLIQLVEPTPPLHDGDVLVLREDGELTAFVQRHEGAAASWLRLFVHPDARATTEAIVESGLRLKPPTHEHPLYCCIPRYQSWLQAALRQLGFAHWGSYAVMVRHTVKRVQAVAPDSAALVQAKGVARTSPFAQK
jgi:hypothetical protein